MGNQSTDPSDVTFSAEMTNEKFAEMLKKSYKRPEPTSKKEYYDEIYRISEKLSTARDQIRRIIERRNNSNSSLQELADDLVEEERYREDLKNYGQKLEKLQKEYNDKFGGM